MNNHFRFPRFALAATLAASFLVASSHLSFGASASWVANPTSNLWEPLAGQTNWSTGPGTFPGATFGITNTDIATFNVVSTITNITINNALFPASLLNIQGMTFTGAPSNYVIGSNAGQGIFLTTGGSFNMTGITNGAVETVAAPLAFGTAQGVYAFTNNSANGTLHITGSLADPVVTPTSGSVTLTLNGSNTNLNSVTGSIHDGGFGGQTNITKDGFGTWILGGINNTYTGPVNINNGTLEVASVSALGLGNTTIVGILPNFGVLKTAGAGPIFFNVGNNFTILGGTPFNILEMKVGGTVPFLTADHMSVGNNANLAGELFVRRINNYMPLPGDEVQIISTGGTVNGTFMSVQSDFPGLVQPIAVYFPQAVDVRFVLANTFVSQALTFNQQQAAHAVDLAFANLCLSPAQRAILGSIPVAFLPAAFDLLAPEEFGALYEMSFSRAVMQNNNLQHRMDQVRANADPNCGPVVEVAPEGKDKNMMMPPAPPPSPRFNTFATGSGEYVAVHDQDANAQGYRITNGTFLAGADYSFLNMFAIGIYGGYAGSEAELVNNGHINADGGQVGGYATFFTHGFYIQGAGGAGWNSYENRRGALGFINGLPKPTAIASSSTDGDEVNAMGAIGYDWNHTFTFANHPGTFTAGPIFTVQYTNIDIDEFTERGSLVPLHFDDQSQDSLRFTIGGKVALCVQTDHGIMWKPDIRVAYLHEDHDQRYEIESNFVGCPDPFVVLSPKIGDDAVAVNAGLTVQFNPMVSIFAHYDGQFGRDNYHAQGVTGGLGLSF